MIDAERWLEVKRITSEAWELPTEMRSTFLAQSCPDTLREDVERLLRSCDRASSASFVDRPALEFAAPIIASIDNNPIDLIALKTHLAGQYSIEREIGRGGMATVYLAHDERHGRRVALKVVHQPPSQSLASAPARFQREIGIAARLTHPHILPLHNSGEANGVLYYVMPFVSGEDLRERLARDGRLSVQETLKVLRDVTRALAYAHAQGIVHRDIKPGNILLSDEGDALIADFGIASTLLASGENGGNEYGTLAYSAPEQLRREPVDERADLYSLGVTAAEMLCGARLPTNESVQALQRSNVPPALIALIQRLVAADPADRPREAGDVLRTLDAVYGDRADAQNSSPAIRQIQRWILVTAGVMTIALIVGAARSVLVTQSSARSAERGTNNPEAWQAYVRGRSLFDDPRRGNLPAAIKHFERARELDSNLARAWAGLANTYTIQAVFSDDSGDIVAKARDALARALRLDSTLAEARLARAHQLFVFDCRAGEAERGFKQVLATDSTNATARRWYGLLLHFTGRHDSALAQLHMARRLAPTLPGAETLLGRVFVNIDQPDSAIIYLRSALTFSPDLDIADQQLAFAWLEKKMNDSAVAAMERAASLNGSDSAQLAYIDAMTGNRAEAENVVQQLTKREPGRQLPPIGMAMAYAGIGDRDEAFRRLERSACLAGVEVAAGFESLRSDSRFADLIRRKGLRVETHQ